MSAAGIDTLAKGRFSDRADDASDALLAMMAAAAVVSVAASRYPAEALCVQAGAVAATGLVAYAFKRLVRRPRPYTDLQCADVDEGECDELTEAQFASDKAQSFISGHTAIAFALATSRATMFSIDSDSKPAVAGVWVLGVASAGTVGTLRVVAGKHYPTDVIAGAVVGTIIGVGMAFVQSYGKATRIPTTWPQSRGWRAGP